MENPNKKISLDSRPPSRAEMRRSCPKKADGVPGGYSFSPGILPSSNTTVVVLTPVSERDANEPNSH